MSSDLYAKEFTDSLTGSSQKIAVHVLNRLGEKDLINCNYLELEQIIIDAKPKSKRDITTICFVISQYAKWMESKNILLDDSLYQMVKVIDRKTIWGKSKQFTGQKFVSYQTVYDIVHDIGVYEELNSLYYQCLLQCLFEGIYSDTLTVLDNLRTSDIHDNMVVLHDSNDRVYHMEIPSKLINDLNELSEIDVWEKRNRWGVYERKICGLYSDSCFKFDMGSDFSSGFTFAFYSKIRKIIKDYFEFQITPLNIYISGIMYRIKSQLELNGITLEDAFSYNRKSFDVNNIIKNELNRSHYNIEVKRFRENVSDYLDDFK